MDGARHDRLVAAAAEAQARVASLALDARLERAAAAGAALRVAGERIVDAAVGEVGQPRRFARRELTSALGLIDALPALAEAIRPREVPAVAGSTRLRWEPYGVVLGWHAANSPVWVPTLVVLSALVAGNAVLSRPSARARATTGLVVEAIRPHWPEDAVTVVDLPAPEAEPLIWHPGVQAVVTHASTETCRRQLAGLGRAYAEAGVPLRPYIPEASGNDPLLVLRGADLRRAAEAAALGGFANGGQLCMAAKRIIVARELWPAFRQQLEAAVGRLVTGPADDEATDVAPLVPGPARDRARQALAEALAVGARVVIGAGEVGEAFSPTVVLLDEAHLGLALWREETFAPLRGLVLADDLDHAIALANDSRFALGAAVFGGPPDVAARLRAARVVVDESPLYQDAHLVVGGVGDSGLAGARPKLEQLVWARRVHRGAPD
jgi:acyl-CoA reductase-like NAD-dependent aldehyde dehydrogenase